MMNPINTNDSLLKTEIYADMINDRQGKLIDYMLKHPNKNNEELMQLKKKLAKAHKEVRILVDETHFLMWERIITETDAAIIKASF